MSDRTVVYRAGPNSETSDKVAARLRAGGVEVLNQQPNILLVNGASHAVSQALGDVPGWNVSAETKTPPPSTREKALKPPG